MAAESLVPLFPCKQLGPALAFYRALGFEVTHEQEEPYLYGCVRRGGIELHLASLAVYGAKNAFGAALVFVDDVASVHRAFAAGLRAQYGKVPTAGLPRLARMPREPTRFKVFDPSGNLLILIRHDEPAPSYAGSGPGLSALASALENAWFFRDTYANDSSAANVLLGALRRHPEAVVEDRARAWAALAELGVAIGDAELIATARTELHGLQLSPEDQERLRPELSAAGDLERWLVEG
jgi:hypothetical protein